jgi:hypothetical protein
MDFSDIIFDKGSLKHPVMAIIVTITHQTYASEKGVKALVFRRALDLSFLFEIGF